MRMIGEWLTRPGPAVADAERRRARLVSSILVVLVVLGTCSAAIQLALVPGFLPSFAVIMTAVAVLAGAWALNRSGRGTAATMITCAVPTVAAFAAVLANPDDAGALAFALLGVIAASLLVSTRAGAILAALAVAGVPLVEVVRPEAHGALLAAMSAFLVIGSLLVVVSARHRDRVEDDRRRETERMMAHLQKIDRLAALGTVAASVAHEINNPLMFISANLEMLARDRGAADRGEMIAEAMLGVDQITSVVRTLSAFARGDRDDRQPVDVARALETAMRMAEPHIRGRARLARCFAEVPRIAAGKHRLEQVFLNLLLNAVQAIPDCGNAEEHEIAVRLASSGDGSVHVEVTDTGVGIPADALDRIFEPFYSTKAEGSGTGLGLTVCRDIVTALGGHIQVDSVVGQGTTIRVALPEAR